MRATWKTAHGDPRRLAWRNHKRDAANRGIGFHLTFEEWSSWWKSKLGPHWLRRRGLKADSFVMARLGDKGNYELGNIKCITRSENRLEQIFAPETRARMNLNLQGWPKGKPHSEKTKRKIRRSKLGHRHSNKTTSRMSISQRIRWSQPDTKKQMSEAAKRGWQKRRVE